jgi:hypothetical protein
MRTIGPLLNILLGGFMIYMGVTGRGALPGTQSTIAFAAVGGLAVAYGVFRVIRERRRVQ